MLLVHILVTVVLATVLSRFIRQSSATENLRLNLSARSAFVAKLLSCPHCLTFWAAILCALFLASSMLEFGIVILLGWRGGFYLNRLVDKLSRRAIPQPAKNRPCYLCGAPYNKDFLKRQHLVFCSHRCWFEFLKDRPKKAERLFDKNDVFIQQEVYLMSFENINPARASELLDGDQGVTYIDVRSIPEFENGHPTGAVNIPLMHRQQDQMVPNMDFLRIVEVNFDKEANLIIGCQSGARSQRAAEALIASGYTHIHHMDGGFGGARNELGQVIEKGWVELALPIENGAAEGQSYTSLGGTK